VLAEKKAVLLAGNETSSVLVDPQKGRERFFVYFRSICLPTRLSTLLHYVGDMLSAAKIKIRSETTPRKERERMRDPAKP
jgi:hypothetical protein